jgi:hypothetical protein
MLLGDRIKPYLEPVMEDWGWTFEVLSNAVRIGINVWAYHPIEHCWIFGVDARPGFWTRRPIDPARESVCNSLEKILRGDARFLKHEWFENSPWDLMIEKF